MIWRALTFLAVAAAFTTNAQSIENASRSTIGYLGADGRIENSSRSTVGYIQTSGSGWTIENASRSTIGYINARSDDRYTIENASRSTMGYVYRSGDTWTVENSSRSTVGHIDKDGRVEDGSRSTVGYARDLPPAWVAVHFFFFRFPQAGARGFQRTATCGNRGKDEGGRKAGATIFADPKCPKGKPGKEMQFTAIQIAELLQGDVDGDPQVVVSDLAKIEEARSGTLTFLANPRYTEFVYSTKASIVIVQRAFHPAKAIPKTLTLIRVDDPRHAFTLLLERSTRMIMDKTGVEQPSYVSPTAKLGKGVYIGAFCHVGDGVVLGNGVKVYPGCFIGHDAKIGDDSLLYAGVKVYHRSHIGARCVLHSGSVIGADGFGFVPDHGGIYEKMPQVGNVILEDDVEVGANTTIDRATIGHTVIRKGTKLDNLVQVGHNAEVGQHVVVVAQTGIAGSSKVGDHAQIGGQVGIAGHLHVGRGVKVAAQSGIGSDIPEDAVVQGSPAFNIGEYKRSYVHFRNLPEIMQRMNQLEKEIEELKAAMGPTSSKGA